MEGGFSTQNLSEHRRANRFAKFASKQALLVVVVAVIGLVFRLTGSANPGSTADQSVLVLAILIAQITVPRRAMLRSPSRAFQRLAAVSSTPE
jgi:hypothetical protein